MGLFALGKLTGVIIHSGFGTTTISCLYEGTSRSVNLSLLILRVIAGNQWPGSTITLVSSAVLTRYVTHLS